MTRTMSKTQQDAFVRHLEDQGCAVRRTSQGGFFIYFPDGGKTSVHVSTSDIRAEKNAIATFRRHGIHHPNDPKEIDMVANKNDEGYPDYMTGPITSTTRKTVLAELESRGWPLRLRAKDLAMDTVTANRALYAVGYRWEDPESPSRNRYWKAPDEIKELHERVQAEMKEREEEARRQRQERVLRALPRVQEDVDVSRETFPEIEVPVTVENVHLVQAAADLAKPAGEAEEPEREFIDTVDSWVIDDGAPDVYIPMPVRKYLSSLRGAGLELEIRVWRTDRPKGEQS